MEFDRDKFKRLVHYVISQTGKSAGFGATKLNKVLWYAETRAYMLRGRPIAAATYIREKRGPVPREIMSVRDELEREGSIRITQDRHYNRTQTRFEALVRPDVSDFDAEDMRDVDYWIRHIDEDHTANSISEKSHDYMWDIARQGEVIPYHAVFATRVREPKGGELDWARSQVRQRDLF